MVAIRSKELRLVEKNNANVKPDSSVASRGMKTYSGVNFFLDHFLKETGKSANLEENGGKSQFSSSEQPCEPKSLDVGLKITGAEKIPSENLWLRST